SQVTRGDFCWPPVDTYLGQIRGLSPATRGYFDMATVNCLLDRVTELARSLKVTRGRKLRIDSTVVATAIHYPTDSTLLADGVRVLSRVAQRAVRVLSGQVRRLGSRRTR